MKLNSSMADSSIGSAGDLLGLSAIDTAHGVHDIANANMIRAIRAVSTYRGRDPRDFTLLAFGGSGPIHAANMARALGIKTVIVPPSPGLFSAIGLLQAKPERHFVQTHFTSTSEADPEALNRVFEQFIQQSTDALVEDGYSAEDIRWGKSLDIRYAGQAHELTISTADDILDSNVLRNIVCAFHEEHDRTYGHKAEDESTEIVNLRLTAFCRLQGAAPIRMSGARSSTRPHRRMVSFDPKGGRVRTDVIDRAGLPASPRAGPAHHRGV